MGGAFTTHITFLFWFIYEATSYKILDTIRPNKIWKINVASAIIVRTIRKCIEFLVAIKLLQTQIFKWLPARAANAIYRRRVCVCVCNSGKHEPVENIMQIESVIMFINTLAWMKHGKCFSLVLHWRSMNARINISRQMWLSPCRKKKHNNNPQTANERWKSNAKYGHKDFVTHAMFLSQDWSLSAVLAWYCLCIASQMNSLIHDCTFDMSKRKLNYYYLNSTSRMFYARHTIFIYSCLFFIFWEICCLSPAASRLIDLWPPHQ